MRFEKLLRDPIHDLISVDLGKAEGRLLLDAMNTHEVQRLRRIKQLGMAHMAYQGAEHSRFAHSIGVVHLLRRLLDRLDEERTIAPEWRIATLMAGMVHDLGHGPFSHVMEKFFREHHENWSRRIILSEETEINQLLSRYNSELPAMVVKVLSGQSDPPFLSSLISSQMDADRFDYLLRDAHMTGVKYGVFDLERLVLMFRVTEDHERVYIASKGLMAVEKYLQSRYQMYRQVYFHKTVTSAEAMLMALLDRARELVSEGVELPGVQADSPLGKLLQEENLTVAEFLRLDDNIILAAMNAWMDAGDEVLRDLSLRLLNRRLFKSIEISSDQEEEELDLLFNDRLQRARDFLTEKGLDFRYYLRFSKSADTPYKPYSSRGTKSTIWIEDADQQNVLHDVKDISPTIRAFTESPYAIHRAFFPDMAGSESIRKELTAILMG